MMDSLFTFGSRRSQGIKRVCVAGGINTLLSLSLTRVCPECWQRRDSGAHKRATRPYINSFVSLRAAIKASLFSLLFSSSTNAAMWNWRARCHPEIGAIAAAPFNPSPAAENRKHVWELLLYREVDARPASLAYCSHLYKTICIFFLIWRQGMICYIKRNYKWSNSRYYYYNIT